MTTILHQSRINMGEWKKINDPDVLQQWRMLLEKISQTEKNAESCIGYLYHFVILYNTGRADASHQADLRTLSGTREDSEKAAIAWQMILESGNWNKKHASKVRTYLSRVLLHLVPALAYIVNPTIRTFQKDTIFQVERSFLREFTLHDCLPLRVRALTSRSIEYRILARVMDEMASHLKSVSKGHLQRMALFMDAIINGGGIQKRIANEQTDVEDIWSVMRKMKPIVWLRRFDEMFCSREKVTFEHFKRQIRHLHVLHCKVLCPGTKVFIPIPTATVRIRCTEALHQLSSASGSLSTSAGSTEIDEAMREERQKLREYVSNLKAQMCSITDTVEAANKVFAFNPSEIRAIFEACSTVLERLIMTLFFTTGMRIGGVCRLKWTKSDNPRAPLLGRNIPDQISSIEKGGKTRTVRLTETARILIARWYNKGRGQSQSLYLFPSARNEDGCISSRHMWTICNRVFQAAELKGEHVHPHTMRHTVIQMLYLSGMKFDAISKWIGHSHASITSNIYGKLSQRDIQLSGVPFAAENDGDNRKEEWRKVSKFVHCPFNFDDDEWIGLKRPKRDNDVACDTGRSKKRQALDHATEVLSATPSSENDLRTTLRELVRDVLLQEKNKNQS